MPRRTRRHVRLVLRTRLRVRLVVLRTRHTQRRARLAAAILPAAMVVAATIRNSHFAYLSTSSRIST